MLMTMISQGFTHLSIHHQLQQTIPLLSPTLYKGQLGRVGIVGGCFEYTGAPFVAATSALKTGADLSYVFCSKDAAIAIKSYGPEVIVLPSLRTVQESNEEKSPKSVKDIVADILSWVSRLHVLVIGPGLGRDKMIQETTGAIIRGARDINLPLLIDADGLWTVENDPSLVQDYPLAILTPNGNEYKRLCVKILHRDITEDKDPVETVKELARRLGNVTIVRKGATDIISNGSAVIECNVSGGPRRCGGQGDVLAGTIATFAAWASRKDITIRPYKDEPILPNLMLAAYGGCTLTRDCSRVSFENKKRAMVGFDLVEVLGQRFYELFEHKSSSL